jgi:ABC-type bacteriocin/lantibiotic exporter with double-glycine peptidase domain
MGYAQHFVSLPVADIEKLNAGEQLSKLQNEIAGVSDYLTGNLFQLADDSIKFILTFIWLLFISPALTLASNIPVIFILFYVYWSSRIISGATEQAQIAKGRMNQYADTLLTLFPVIRLYDAARLTMGGYLDAVAFWKNQTISMEHKKAWLMSLSAVLSAAPLLLLFLIGGQMAIKGILTVGTLYIFVNLSGNVSGVMMNMPGYITAFRQFSANMERLSPYILLDGKNDLIKSAIEKGSYND